MRREGARERHVYSSDWRAHAARDILPRTAPPGPARPRPIERSTNSGRLLLLDGITKKYRLSSVQAHTRQSIELHIALPGPGELGAEQGGEGLRAAFTPDTTSFFKKKKETLICIIY